MVALPSFARLQGPFGVPGEPAGKRSSPGGSQGGEAGSGPLAHHGKGVGHPTVAVCPVLVVDGIGGLSSQKQRIAVVRLVQQQPLGMAQRSVTEPPRQQQRDEVQVQLSILGRSLHGFFQTRQQLWVEHALPPDTSPILGNRAGCGQWGLGPNRTVGIKISHGVDNITPRTLRWGGTRAPTVNPVDQAHSNSSDVHHDRAVLVRLDVPAATCPEAGKLGNALAATQGF